MCDQSWDFLRHELILVSQCPMTDYYLQPWLMGDPAWAYTVDLNSPRAASVLNPIVQLSAH